MRLRATCLVCLVACGDDLAPLAGGATTVFDRSSNAFSYPAPNLGDIELARHLAGDAEFEAVFVSAPAPVNPGLGPLFNSAACVACHNRDGRGQARFAAAASSALVRVSREGQPLPDLGAQLQDHAVPSAVAEARITLMWTERTDAYPDGQPYALRRPALAIELATGPLPSDVETSMRIAPAVFGLGLLEAIPEDTLVDWEDPDDRDGDGISGRRNRVFDPTVRREVTGRFGWKANNGSLRHQVAGAYAEDMGVGSRYIGERIEIDDRRLDDARTYVATLGVPAADDLAPDFAVGATFFDALGCEACHRRSAHSDRAEFAATSYQLFAPYTDLLLHDMGPELADGRSDHLATGAEWRTPPLWGLGLVQTVLPGAGFLHDGRARSIEEAILWHGGEAEASREAFRQAPRAEREALLAFLTAL